MWLARDKKQQIDKAIEETVKRISQDDQLRENMIKHIIANQEFQNKFDALIDNSVNDKLDDKINDGIKNSVEKTLIKGLEK